MLLAHYLSTIFALYNSEGEEQIIISAGNFINFYYKDNEGYPNQDNNIRFDVRFDDEE